MYLLFDDKSNDLDLQGHSGQGQRSQKMQSHVQVISQLFLNQIPPDLVCDIIILFFFVFFFEGLLFSTNRLMTLKTVILTSRGLYLHIRTILLFEE